MIGLNAETGRAIEGVAHLGQSVSKCLTTPLGTRTNRRWFGSELLDLQDAPINEVTCVRLYAATATCLMQNEPRLRLSRVSLVIDPQKPGALIVDVQGTTNISRDAVSVRVQLS